MNKIIVIILCISILLLCGCLEKECWCCEDYLQQDEVIQRGVVYEQSDDRILMFEDPFTIKNVTIKNVSENRVLFFEDFPEPTYYNESFLEMAEKCQFHVLNVNLKTSSSYASLNPTGDCEYWINWHRVNIIDSYKIIGFNKTAQGEYDGYFEGENRYGE